MTPQGELVGVYLSSSVLTCVGPSPGGRGWDNQPGGFGGHGMPNQGYGQMPTSAGGFGRGAGPMPPGPGGYGQGQGGNFPGNFQGYQG